MKVAKCFTVLIVVSASSAASSPSSSSPFSVFPTAKRSDKAEVTKNCTYIEQNSRQRGTKRDWEREKAMKQRRQNSKKKAYKQI